MIRAAITLLAPVLLLHIATARAVASVDLQLRPVLTAYESGETVEFELWAVSDDGTNQAVLGLQLILVWNPAHLELLGVNNNGPHDWHLSGFFDDSALDGLNNQLDDGDAYYQAAANLTTTPEATPEGLLVTTLQLRALTPTPETTMSIVPTLGGLESTTVFGFPGVDATGMLGSAGIAINPTVDWGRLDILVPDGTCCLQPGVSFNLLLAVSELLEPIREVQALLQYDHEMLTLIGVMGGDNAGSPWDAASAMHETVAPDVTVVQLLLPNGSPENAVVATIQFTVTVPDPPRAARVDLVTQAPPLVTRFILASAADPIIPQLQGPAIVGSAGDPNGDDNIDLLDHAAFASCLGGPGGIPPMPECCCFDLDQDDDVDLDDFRVFAVAFTGSESSNP